LRVDGRLLLAVAGATLLVSRSTPWAAGQSPSPAPAAIRVVSPAADSYVSGPTTIAAEIAGQDSAAVERVTIFADGRLVCAIEQPPFSCPWDAGPGVREHVIRVVAALSGGTRSVTSIRTAGVKYADTAEVHAVQVNVLVKDKDGRFVSGLTAKDFRLLEDGAAQTITHVADEDTALETVMALDISGSMAGVMGDVKSAAVTFTEALRPRDVLTVMGFNDNIFTVARREMRPDARTKALARLAPWGGTALYDAISRSLSLLEKQPGRKGLVLLSDGDDESSRMALSAVEQELQSSDAVLYAVALGRGTEQRTLRALLQRLSEPTGGRLVMANESAQLSTAFADVVADLSHQYVLSYVPTNSKRDGTWRKLTVEIPGKSYHLRARQGYLARQSVGSGAR
jgi:Ca-activated chloride channel homolog